MSVGVRRPRPPLAIAAAAEYGVPPDAGWEVALGQGDALSRNVFHLFPDGAAARPSRRTRHGYWGALRVDGIEASLENAAAGPPLPDFLLAPGSRERKIRLAEDLGT